MAEDEESEDGIDEESVVENEWWRGAVRILLRFELCDSMQEGRNLVIDARFIYIFSAA